jgi:hypothetical protein
VRVIAVDPRFAELIDKAIPFLGGLYCTLLGFRILGKKPGVSANYDAWYDRHAGKLRVLGPFLMVGSAFFVVRAIIQFESRKTTHAPNWQRVATSDGVCSAEFPGTPKHDVTTTRGVQVSHRTLTPNDADFYFSIIVFDFPPSDLAPTVDDRLDAVRDTIPTMAAHGTEIKLVTEQRVNKGQLIGRRMVFTAGPKHVLRTTAYLEPIPKCRRRGA